MVVAERSFGAFANKTFAKGKLKIFPMGQLAHVKEVKANMTLIHCPDDFRFQIIPPKVGLEKKTGILVPFFHLVKKPRWQHGGPHGQDREWLPSSNSQEQCQS